MKTIVLKSEIGGSFSNADGYTLFCILKPYFLESETVCISMLGFDVMSSSFFNSSFGELIQEFGIESFRATLKFTSITNTQAKLIRKYLEYHLH